MTGWVAYAAKSVYAAGVAFCGTLGTALLDGHVTGQEWTVIAGATLIAGGAVFKATNGSKPGA